MSDSFRAHATGDHIDLPDMKITIQFDKPVVVDTLVGLVAANNKHARLFSCNTMKAGESTVKLNGIAMLGLLPLPYLRFPDVRC